MPQMSPMIWILLFFSILTIFYFLYSMFFYSFKYYSKNFFLKNKNMKKTISLNW